MEAPTGDQSARSSPAEADPSSVLDCFAGVMRWTEEVQRYASSFKTVFDSVQKSIAEASAGLQKFANDAASAMSGVRETLTAFGVAYSEYCSIMAKQGWPPLMYPDMSLIWEVVERRGDLGDTEFKVWLNGRLVAYHPADQMNDILCRWESRPCLSNRIHILREVIPAHVAGSYALTVPAVLAQIEGLLMDLFDHRKRQRQSDATLYLRRLVGSGEDLSRMRVWMLSFMEDVFYEEFHRGDVIPDGPSRHAVLHGAKLDYPSEVNSLKVILALDLLSSYATVASRFGDPEYHRVGCPSLGRPGLEVVYHGSVEVAEKLCLAPCPACCPR